MARVADPPEIHDALGPGVGVETRPEGVPDGSTTGWRDRVRWRIAPMSMGAARRAVALLAALVLVVLAVLAVVLRSRGPQAITQSDVDNRVRAGIEQYSEGEARAPSDASVVYAAIQPSLVVVTTTGRTNPAGEKGVGTGAGVIVTAQGMILTALHVVDGAAAITVSYADGTSSPAQIAARRAADDMATLTPQRLPSTVVPAVLGGSVPVGAPVFAVGHPFGLTDSLSAGVVSALDRTMTTEEGTKLRNLIQFDASVNPGNSGGPLLNRAGQVVGIVTGLANPSAQSVFVGIGFAVPIATAGGAAGSPPR